MNTIDFENEFLNIDFDGILIRNDNPLVNSFDHYIQYKNKYVEEAKSAQSAFIQLTNELDSIQNQSYIKNESSTKIRFQNVDQDVVNGLKHRRKEIVSHQRYLLEQFLHYIDTLNKDFPRITAPVERPASLNSSKSRRGLFARLKR